MGVTPKQVEQANAVRLKFTAEQKKAAADLQKQMIITLEDDTVEAEKKAMAKMDAVLKKMESVLTAQQKERFKRMQGKPLKRSA